jgi:outer membrane protein W
MLYFFWFSTASALDVDIDPFVYLLSIGYRF